MSNGNEWSRFAQNYSETVYSITAVPEKRKRILQHVNDGEKVLILGCGSEVHLQKELLENRQRLLVVASDFSDGMLQRSGEKFRHPGLIHIKGDIKDLPFLSGEFNTAISTNSIIPPIRDDVSMMYGGIHRILTEGGDFLAYLPSFDCAAGIKNQFPGLPIDLDPTQLRITDTTGWQCFHTEESIKNELGNAGFQLPEGSIQRIGVEREQEREQLAKVYGNEIADHVWEFFVRAQKNSKPQEIISPKITSTQGVPIKTEVLPGGKYQVEVYSSAEITPEMIKEVSDFYRETFNNNGHFLVFPSTMEFISPQQYFQTDKHVSLKEMDSITNFPINHITGEQAIFWHHPEVTKEIIGKKLEENAHISLLRSTDSRDIYGLMFGNKTQMSKQYELEGWRNPFLYSGIEIQSKNRCFVDFLNKLNNLIMKNNGIFGENFLITNETEVYAWNTIATSVKTRGLDYLLPMSKNFFEKVVSEGYGNLPVVSETRIGSTSDKMFRAGGYIHVPGILNNSELIKEGDSTIIIVGLDSIARFFSLNLSDFIRKIVRYKKNN